MISSRLLTIPPQLFSVVSGMCFMLQDCRLKRKKQARVQAGCPSLLRPSNLRAMGGTCRPLILPGTRPDAQKRLKQGSWPNLKQFKASLKGISAGRSVKGSWFLELECSAWPIPLSEMVHTWACGLGEVRRRGEGPSQTRGRYHVSFSGPTFESLVEGRARRNQQAPG